MEEIIFCECGSVEHQIVLRGVDGDDSLYAYVHLTKLPLFRRIWHGIKYIFGYRCKYGDFDEVIISKSDCRKFEKIVEFFKGNVNNS